LAEVHYWSAAYIPVPLQAQEGKQFNQSLFAFVMALAMTLFFQIQNKEKLSVIGQTILFPQHNIFAHVKSLYA